MTVFNRSNDLVWGVLGTNITTFSFLQEYMAAHLNLPVGPYNQITDDLHVYTERWEPTKWLESEDPTTRNMFSPKRLTYETHVKTMVPLVRHPDVFAKELPRFVEEYSGGDVRQYTSSWEEPFFQQVAMPMLLAYRNYKEALRLRSISLWSNAMEVVKAILADDWQLAAYGWLKRRYDKAQARMEEERKTAPTDAPSSSGKDE